MRKNKSFSFIYRVGVNGPEQIEPANGKKFTLKELQEFVGGYIQLVPGVKSIVFCNEEGLLKRLPFNPLASRAFKRHLVGNVVLISQRHMD